MKFEVVISQKIVVEAEDEEEAIDRAKEEFLNQFDRYMGQIGFEEFFDIKVKKVRR